MNKEPVEIYVKYTGIFRNNTQSFDGKIYCFNKRKRIHKVPQQLFAKLLEKYKGKYEVSSEEEYLKQLGVTLEIPTEKKIDRKPSRSKLKK